MARVQVQLADNIKRVVFLDPDATSGATIGKDLRLPDGSIATVAKLAALFGLLPNSGNGGVVDHRFMRGLAVGDDHPQYARRATAINPSTGLTGGGDLSANRTLGLNSASVASLVKADTAGQIQYIVQSGASVTYSAGQFRRGRTIIGVRYAGAATVILPHDLPIETLVTVKDEAGTGNITVSIL